MSAIAIPRIAPKIRWRPPAGAQRRRSRELQTGGGEVKAEEADAVAEVGVEEDGPGLAEAKQATVYHLSLAEIVPIRRFKAAPLAASKSNDLILPAFATKKL